MTVIMDALVPALEDAREAHAAVITRFRADLAVTPAGPHRQTLEHQATQVQDSIARIDDRIREIRPRQLLRDTTKTVRAVSEGAVRAARTPLDIGAQMAGGVLRGGRPAGERQVLKNTEEEYTITTRARVVCRAGESIAALAQDQRSADLLDSVRRQDEQLLQTLERSIEEQARALAAAAANGSRPAVQPDGGLVGAAARTVRTAVDRLRHAAASGGQQTARTAAGAAREMPTSATRMAEQVQGAVTREEDLPLPGYARLTATEVTERLRTLSQSDLTVIEGHERAHANRSSVLDAIQDLRGPEPWPGYDTMDPDQITARLQTAEPALAREAAQYERRHRQRQEILTAATNRTEPCAPGEGPAKQTGAVAPPGTAQGDTGKFR